MTGQNDTEKPRDTAERIFKHSGFTISWVAFLGAFLTFVSWPIRNFFLVCWIYGCHAYFQEGIRVLKGKPVRFSNGVLAPKVPDLVTGFGAFFVTALGLTMLLIFLVRFYERHFRKSKSNGF
jgi:hypothetical protein